jgi:hypothetical protein
MAFAPQVDGSGNPVGTTDTFPAGTTQVYCVFEYEGFSSIAEYRAVFYRDGEDDVSGSLEHDGTDSGQTWVRRFNDAGLVAGEYTIEIYVQDTLLHTAKFTVEGAKVAFEDDFSDSEDGWDTKDTEVSKVWYEGEKLHLLLKQGGWTTFSVYEGKTSIYDDFALEADAAVVELPEAGAEYGIVARRKGKDYYQFLLRANGYYKIRKHTEDGWTTLVDWAKSSAVKSGVNAVNRMRVECVGSTLRFYANETFLGEVEDSSFTGGQIGLMAGSFQDGEGVHVVFDNVVVYDY